MLVHSQRDPIAITSSMLAYKQDVFQLGPQGQVKRCAHYAASVALRHYLATVLLPQAGYEVVTLEFGAARRTPLAHARRLAWAMGIEALPDDQLRQAMEEVSPERMRKVQAAISAGVSPSEAVSAAGAACASLPLVAAALRSPGQGCRAWRRAMRHHRRQPVGRPVVYPLFF